MPAISRIRFTNVVYENGRKRYNDDIFNFDGYNGAILIENGGGKTVFVQTAIQAILPHHDMADRKIRETLSLEGSPCHIAIEWIINERPRRYLLTAVTLFISNNRLDSYKYVYEYGHDDSHNIEAIPFTRKNQNGLSRPSSKGEINDYYQYMSQQYMDANTFKTIRDFHRFIEENYQIVPVEWRNISLINSAEGGVESFFENCKTTTQLVDKLLIPTVEDAVSGNGTKDFVESFEKQRERFKRHKQLRERIEESKEIRNEIDKYVGIFSQYHDVDKSFNGKKAYAKAMNNYTEKEKDAIEGKITDIKNDIEVVNNQTELLEKKKSSYELAIIKKELEHRKTKFESSREEYNHILNKYNNRTKEKINLEISKLKKEIKDSHENINNYKLQLKRYEENTDIQEIREELEENSSKLKGYYVTQEANLSKEKALFKNQKSNYLEELNSSKDELKKHKVLKDNIHRDINQKQGEIKQIDKNLQSILNKLFNVSKHDNMESKKIEWSKRIGELEKKLAHNNEKILNLENERLKLNTDLNQKRISLSEAQRKNTSIEERIKSIDQNQDYLLLKVKELNSSWYTMGSLYTRQESIISYLQNKIMTLEDEREDILINERIASRFSDYYRDSTYFSPEPILEKQVDDWKGQLSYIELGIRYIERAAKNLKRDEREFFDTYPYWSLSIIASENDIPKLKDRIDSIKEKITYPIFILSEGEALEILRGKEKTTEHTVFPKYWENNMKKEFFHNWKGELLDKAEKIKQDRIKKELEIEKFRSVLNDLKKFYSEYKYEYYQGLKEENSNLKDEIHITLNTIRNMENRITEIHGEINTLNQESRNISDEKSILNNNVSLAVEYIKGERERLNHQLSINELNEKLKAKKEEITKIEKEILQTEAILNDSQFKIDDNNRRTSKLMDEESYKEVNSYDPKFSDISKEALETERKQLKNLLYEKQEDIKTIEEKIKREERTIERNNTDLKRKRKQADCEIEEDFEFPIYGDEIIDNLIDELEDIKPETARLENEFNKQEKALRDIEKEYDIRKTDFYKLYDEIVIFSDSLYNVELDIEKEDKELKDKKVILKEEEKRLEDEQKNINSILHRFDIVNGKYSFKSALVRDIELDSEVKLDFPYNRVKYLDSLEEELEVLKTNLESYSNKVNTQREAFIIFCNREIKDPRLKERTISGVKEKNRYEDIINWQNKMIENISKTIRIAEDDMREHDKDLQQFIQHLYTYLARLTEELRIIPRNTRIKVEDKWKEIYRFDIPHWNEQEGKEEIRKHVDWMINQLENADFKNEDGSENYTAIRKEIETWLDSKQLLKIVLKNNAIKVSCRKVTNDGKISSAPTTWENSNKWSGGEKWSKNMTLFLGILNYLAEKRQGNVTGQRNRRTVIVDNPFGKASSDHVLDPVFFIAQKLGFQMIALTAHSEGKYIRNYFPVVYSCKLREALTGNSLIIDKEKEIQYAFFKDNAPESLMRLGEQEQMNLFEIS